MKKDKLSVGAKGIVRIYELVDGERKLIIEKNNAVQANARKIIARGIGGSAAFAVDTIEVYKAAALLASQGVLTTEYPAADNNVIFRGIFNGPSFNDTFDELRLTSVVGGQFSIVTGLSILKNSTTTIEVEWEIIITNIANI